MVSGGAIVAQSTLDKPSIWQMVMSPVTQLEKIKQHPVFAQPMVILSLVYLIGNWLAMLGINVPVPQQTEGVWAEIMIGVMVALTFLIALLKPIFITVVLAGIYALCAKVLKYPFSLQQLISMNIHIWIIAGMGVIVNGVITAIFGSDMEHVQHVHTSLAVFIDSEGIMAIILEQINFFSIWVFILSAIGLTVIVGFSKRVAWGIVLGVFMLQSLVSILVYNLAQMFV